MSRYCEFCEAIYPDSEKECEICNRKLMKLEKNYLRGKLLLKDL